MNRRLTHTSNSGTTKSSGAHQLTTDEHPSSDDDVGGSFQGEDQLATESGYMVNSDGSGSTSSNTSKRKKSGRGPGKWEFGPPKPPEARLPNHVIDSLVRKYFTGLAKPNDQDPPSPGFTSKHYQHTKDEHGVTMAAWVIDGFHEAFSCVDGEKDKATKDLVKSFQKILSDVKRCSVGCSMTREAEFGRSVYILEAWKEGHKGKDGADFCSQSVQERYATFTKVFKEVHGQDAVPTSKPLDPELLIIAGSYAISRRWK
ncbi:hypothetical protein ZWY2020_005221 [Hordeum vulgare]|nr:hypothetical protein ZWY2020_005221 [Hordeum vulgare]